MMQLKKITIVDVTVVHAEEHRLTRIHGNAESICFETMDHEGNEREPSFELTWDAIFQACKEYMK